MRRVLLILALIGLTASAGCRICAHPYDYCGPTYVGECSDICCNPYARAGSVLSPPLRSTAGGCEGCLEPIPMDSEMAASSNNGTGHAVPLPSPPRTARGAGPTFLR